MGNKPNTRTYSRSKKPVASNALEQVIRGRHESESDAQLDIAGFRDCDVVELDEIEPSTSMLPVSSSAIS